MNEIDDLNDVPRVIAFAWDIQYKKAWKIKWETSVIYRF